MVEDYFDSRIWPGSAIPDHRPDLVRSVNRLVRACRDSGIDVIWFRQEFEPDLSDAFPHMIRTGRRYAIRDTPGAQLLPELDVEEEDTILTKKRYSTFFGTDLDLLLQHRGVESILFAGITTAWCIRSSAVDAYQRGYPVVVVSDATAGFTDREHRESLTAMGSVIARCIPVDEIVRDGDLLGRRRADRSDQ
jgi:nicotinamidase-related amidase